MYQVFRPGLRVGQFPDYNLQTGAGAGNRNLAAPANAGRRTIGDAVFEYLAHAVLRHRTGRIRLRYGYFVAVAGRAPDEQYLLRKTRFAARCFTPAAEWPYCLRQRLPPRLERGMPPHARRRGLYYG